MSKSVIFAVVLVLTLALVAGIALLVAARSRPSPERFNRSKNTSPEDFDRFIDWWFSHTLSEVRAARGDTAATRAAWIHYFQCGYKAGMSLEEVMGHLPELFRRAQYPDDEARKVLAMLKALTPREIISEPIKPD
jgi:hypothetical protein